MCLQLPLWERSQFVRGDREIDAHNLGEKDAFSKILTVHVNKAFLSEIPSFSLRKLFRVFILKGDAAKISHGAIKRNRNVPNRELGQLTSSGFRK